MKAVLIHRPGSVKYDTVEDPKIAAKDDIILVVHLLLIKNIIYKGVAGPLDPTL